MRSPRADIPELNALNPDRGGLHATPRVLFTPHLPQALFGCPCSSLAFEVCGNGTFLSLSLSLSHLFSLTSYRIPKVGVLKGQRGICYTERHEGKATRKTSWFLGLLFSVHGSGQVLQPSRLNPSNPKTLNRPV